MNTETSSDRTLDDIVEAFRPNSLTVRRCTVLVGAGCSITAGIPSAGDVVRHIKADYPAAYARAKPKDYPGCMAALERGTRRDLICRYIDQAKINWAHVALAQLVENGIVERASKDDIATVRASAFAKATADKSRHRFAVHLSMARPAGADSASFESLWLFAVP